MSDRKVRVAPVARRLAEEAGIDLATLSGSGPGGRIVRADVEAAIPPGGSSASSPAAASGDSTMIPMSRAQATIAARMSAAKANVPEFVVAREIDAGPLLRLREELRSAEPPLPSLNDLVVRATAAALRRHPTLNASWREAGVEPHRRINVGIAVAAEHTLLVPTLFDADLLTLAEIATATRRLADAARASTLSPADLEGGTFTVSNLGGFGATRFTAIVNEPQAAILAVGAATPRAVVGADGALEPGHRMELNLTADHRIVYGADAAAFLATLAELLERPSA